jgi:hypothetical protein
MHAEDITIRSYRKGDEIQIVEMFNEVFAQRRGIDYWYWKYRDNPQGPPIISLAVTAEGILGAHYAAYPLKLCFYRTERGKPEVSTIYHAGDKMTRRQFRAVGFGKNALLARTYTHFTETPVEPDTLFKFGFMTHHSLRFGLLFFNYTIIEPIPYRKLECSKFSGLKINLFKKILNDIRVENLSEIDETWTDFFNRVAPHYRYLVKRDASYVRWRYLQRPDKGYLIIAVKKRAKLAGWAVFYREGNKIIWGDALFERGDLDSVKSALLFLRMNPISSGAEFIECWFPPRPEWWDVALQSLGFRNESEPNNLRFCIGNVLDDDAPENVRKHFYYTMGDSDLF